MHKLKIIIGVFIISSSVYAQSDSIIVSKESSYNSELNYDRIYRLFIEDENRTINHLWKLNLFDFGVLEPNIGYEQRLTRTITSDSYLNIKKLDFDRYLGTTFNVEFEQNFKFYHNLKRRARKGKRFSGFSGNYFSLGGFINSYSMGQNYENYNLFFNEGEPWNDNFELGFQLRYGLHRSLGNIGFIEAYAGLKAFAVDETRFQNNPPEQVSFFGMSEIGIRIGFAIDSFKNLR